ncbi:hypothetical protein SFRURICE_003883 [Spodoptera frugiperda]|nr:hypothetical protein SFRURICE_003883 [Spodoptera frugiperda]
MSRVTKRKHVMGEDTWNDEELPKENQSIVKVLKNRGNNLHAVITPTGEEYLVSMPTKFRKNIWVRRGSFLVVEPIPEGGKVKAEIVKIMNKTSITYYKEKKVWPKEFDDIQETSDGDDHYEVYYVFEDDNEDEEPIDSESDDDDYDDDSTDSEAEPWDYSETDSGHDTDE